MKPHSPNPCCSRVNSNLRQNGFSHYDPWPFKQELWLSTCMHTGTRGGRPSLSVELAYPSTYSYTANPHDHFKNYFLLLNFANNLLSVLADVSVFNPLGTGWTCFLPRVKNKINGPNVALYPREAPSPTAWLSPIYVTLPSPLKSSLSH